mmetsp:Transcript_28092/g.71618  ORF Transcript_28092/g.71618 Transcript_28092/m.71618 type:complete len:200 (-) Transcript_28092:709-1308(-)
MCTACAAALTALASLQFCAIPSTMRMDFLFGFTLILPASFLLSSSPFRMSALSSATASTHAYASHSSTSAFLSFSPAFAYALISFSPSFPSQPDSTYKPKRRKSEERQSSLLLRLSAAPTLSAPIVSIRMITLRLSASSSLSTFVANADMGEAWAFADPSRGARGDRHLAASILSSTVHAHFEYGSVRYDGRERKAVSA